MKRLQKAKLPLSLLFAVLAMVCVAALAASPAHATDITLSTGNSSVTIDPISQAGVKNWTVDGVNQLFQQWFWYGLGTGAQSSVDTIGTPVVSAVGRVADITYANANLSVDILYTLTGGVTGSGRSDLAETINIQNLSRESLVLRFYQYSDFDLNGSFLAGDTVQLLNANTVVQSGVGKPVLTETVATPAPSRFELGFYPNTLNGLNSNSQYTLNDNAGPVGPGDATWAFEWDVTIGPGGSYIISKDKNIAPVPLPPSALLLGTGLLGLVGLRYRSRSKS